MQLHAARVRIRAHVFFAFVAAGVLVSSSPLPGAPQMAAVEVIQGHQAAGCEVLLKLRQGAGRNEVADIAADIDADRHRPVGGAGARLFHSRRFTAAELVDRLSKRANVLYAEPNYIVRALQAPSDPQFGQLWGLQNLGQAVNGGAAGTPGADVHAVAAWEVTIGSRDAVVGVIDTGIDYTHPDLAANVWSAPAQFTVTIGGVPITCPAGTHGFNAITRTCDPMDDHNHGTHVSGTIGAVGNNGVGVAGVNWTAAIMAGKFLGPDGSGTTADGIDAIEFMIQTKAAFASIHGADVRVLSNSWGDDTFSQALLDQINRAADNQMLVVAAAGNSGLPNDMFPMYPASYDAPNIIAVAATDNADRRAYFSNYGATTVHLGAPGVDILSTTIGNTYSFFNGTSMATPHVSGAAALVLSACSLDMDTLKTVLLDSVDQVAGLADVTITGGRLNVDKAIRSCTAAPAVPSGLTATAGDGQVSLAWDAASGAISYNVKRSTNAGGPYTTSGTSKVASYTDKSVTNGVTYYYVVSAVNPLGESANSTEVSATPMAPADLVVSAITVPSVGGAGQTISVTDTTKNQGGNAAPASVTRFYLSTNLSLDAADTLLDGSHAVPSLAAGASSTASTPLTVPAGVGVGMYYLIAKADADNTTVETSESNNSALRGIALGPDLVVSALQVPPTVASGSVVAINETVKNQGGGAAGASTTRFYLSTNLSFDAAADTLLEGSCAVGALAAGASSAGSASVTIPANLAVGTYYLFAVADAGNAVAETSETNNNTFRTTQSGADLVVSALTVPSTGGAGGTILVSDTTKNQGSSAAGASTTRFYLSVNFTWDAQDTLLGGGRAVPSLDPGASSGGSTSVAIPADVGTGTYNLIARSDADSAVAETNETNNATTRMIRIGPDLVVSALQVPSTVAPGSVIAINETVKNQGGGAAGASTTRFYLSTNANFDSADTLLEGSRAVGPLAAAASSAGSTSVTVPANLGVGTYYLFAVADADNAVVETFETNNSTSRMTQAGADLVVSALTVPSTGRSGGTILVSDTTKNQGSSAAAASTTRFYLSANFTWDDADTLLAGGRAVPPLDPGASSAGSTSVAIPAGVGTGTYYVIARSDADNAVPETNETNNTMGRTIGIGPDLVVSALQAPVAVAAGALVSVTDTVKNQGAGASGASTTRFYLSPNVALDAGDALLDGARAIPDLAPGASNMGTTALTIPANIGPGTYYVIAAADGDKAVAETSETNNARSVTVKIGPDLVVSAITIPGSAPSGGTMVVTNTIKNQGAGAAGSTTTRFYLSTNLSLDGSDTVLDGSWVVPPLADGASSAASTTVTIPSGLPAGTYYLITKADADDVVAESWEANNILVRGVQITAGGE